MISVVPMALFPLPQGSAAFTSYGRIHLAGDDTMDITVLWETKSDSPLVRGKGGLVNRPLFSKSTYRWHSMYHP
jgi:hypothetical protein